MNTDGKRSVILSSLALPVTLLVGSTVSWYFKGTNPDNVDVTAGLAYLRPILVSSFVTFAVLMIAGLFYAIRGLRNDTSKDASTLGLMLVIVLSVLSLAAGIASSSSGRVVDNYRKSHSSSTVQN